MHKLRCSQCASIFGITKPDESIPPCPKCNGTLERLGPDSQSANPSDPTEFLSLLSELDDDSDGGAPRPDVQMTRSLPSALSMKHDMRRRKRESQARIAKFIAIAGSVVAVIAILCIVAVGYISNLMEVRELRSDWDAAKAKARENIAQGQFQSARNVAITFENTLGESEAEGGTVAKIEDELSNIYRKIDKARNELHQSITDKLDLANSARLNGDLKQARSDLSEVETTLNGTKGKTDFIKEAEFRWKAESFLVAATPIYNYNQRTSTVEDVLNFAASTNIAEAYSILSQDPRLEQNYPRESLTVIVMYHWSQVVAANELNDKSEWEQSIRLLRDARDAVLKRHAIPLQWPALIVSIEQNLTLTIYDRINTSRAHINQLVNLKLLPAAVLACKDLINFVNDLENVMATTNVEDFTDVEARKKALGFKSYAKELIVELEWRILGLQFESARIKEKKHDEFLEDYISVVPATFSGQCAQHFGQIDSGSKMLVGEMRELKAISVTPRFHNIRSAMARYHTAWKNLASAAANYKDNIGSAKAFDQYVNAADDAISACGVMDRAIQSIPLPPDEAEGAQDSEEAEDFQDDDA